MMKELPSAAKAYKILMQEQTHQELSKTTINGNQETPIACRVDKRKYAKKGKFAQNKRGRYYCDHCEMHGHSLERCWKINGYPPNYRPNTWKKYGANKSSVAQTQPQTTEGTSEPKLTQEQYNKLMCLPSKQLNQDKDKDNSLEASAHNVSKTSKWILDSGASDHISCDITLFKNYKPINNVQNNVTIPNGTSVKIKHRNYTAAQWVDFRKCSICARVQI